jgi:D-alanyl-D-alanine carboxypeptidase
VAFFEPYRTNPAHRWELSPREQLRLVMEKPRLFAPGEGWSYHGSNYLVLKLIVEETTGVTLREALRQRILAPLGLERTDLVEGPLRGDCARGYLPADNPVLPGEGEFVDVTEIDVPFHGAGGGVVSTAGDIATLLQAELRGELLPEALRAEMSAPSTPTGQRPTASRIPLSVTARLRQRPGTVRAADLIERLAVTRERVMR